MTKRPSATLLFITIAVLCIGSFYFWLQIPKASSPTPVELNSPTATPSPEPEITQETSHESLQEASSIPASNTSMSPPPTASAGHTTVPEKSAKDLSKQKTHILEMANTLKVQAPKQTKIKLNISQNIDELLKNAVQLELRQNDDDHTVTIVGLWRGNIKLTKEISYLLVINRPWDYLTDEYLASSCAGVEEGGASIYQKALYNSLQFFETKNQVDGKEVYSLVVIVGNKYVINAALPPSAESTQTNGIAYFKHGKKLQFLGFVDLNKDPDNPKSDCTDFEYKL